MDLGQVELDPVVPGRRRRGAGVGDAGVQGEQHPGAVVAVDVTSAAWATWPVETDLSARTTCLIWAAWAAKSLRNVPVAAAVTRAVSRSKVR